MDMNRNPRTVGETAEDYAQLSAALTALQETVEHHRLLLTNQLIGVFHANGYAGSGEAVVVEHARSRWARLADGLDGLPALAKELAAILGECRPNTSWMDPYNRGGM